MPARDEKNDVQAATDDLLTNGVHRRNFLKFFAGAFAAASVPEFIEACGSPAVGNGGEELANNLESFSSIPIQWVTRKQDGLSLGFQFLNVSGSGANGRGGNITVQGAPGSAYIAITFPPQHVMEQAFSTTNPPPNPIPSVALPVSSVASGVSRLVFNVPTTYGAATDAGGIPVLPFTLQGVLELCAASQAVVSANAAVASPVTPDLVLSKEEREYESIAQARIDRVISHVDPKAAARVRRRSLRAVRMLNPELHKKLTAPRITPQISSTPGLPVMPSNGQTSIELPFRVLMSPDSATGWSFMSAPVTSPNIGGIEVDAQRAELWHARMARLDSTGVPDLSLKGLAVRALYTRDWDVYGQTSTYGTYKGPGNNATTTTGNGNLPEPNAAYASDPVALANPDAPNREALVLQSGNMAVSPTLPPLNVNRLMLSPAGGTLDAWADWTNSPNIYGLSYAALEYWKQNTVLGRDEYVECVNAVTIQPGGFSGVLVTINKRAEDPTQGVVGVLYQTQTLAITTPIVSFVEAAKASPSDYRTFPFVALKTTQAKIAVAPIAPGATAWVNDPTGAPVTIGIVATDCAGNTIKFSTPIVISPPSAGATAAGMWNAGPNGAYKGLGPSYQFDNQRISFAPPASGTDASSSNYSASGTCFPTTSFNIILKSPSTSITSNPTAAQIVPMAQSMQIAVEAVAHLQSTPQGTPPPTASTGATAYDYDLVCYQPYGFDTSKNPNELFLTLTNGTVTGTGPTVDFTKNPAQSGGLATPAITANALSRSNGIVSGTVQKAPAPGAPAGGAPPTNTSPLYSGGLSPTDIFNTSPPELFGFVPLTSIISGLEGLCSQFMPKAVTKELSNAEAFLEEAIGLYNLISNLASSSTDDSGGQASIITSILNQVAQDLQTYSTLAQGGVPQGGTIAGGTSYAEGAPMTNAQMQAAAWLQSAATQAQLLLQQYQAALVTIAGDAVWVFKDITALDFDYLFSPTNPDNPNAKKGDLLDFIDAINGFLQEVESLVSGLTGSPSPQSAAGAIMSYFGPILKPIQDAMSKINGFLYGVSGALSQLETDLAILSQGLDLAKNLSVEFKWQPIISGLEASVGSTEVVAFIPQSNKGFSLDIKVNATASGGDPAGVNITIRLDSFAIAFGGSLPSPDPTKVVSFGPLSAGPIACGYSQTLQNADVSLVFDHMQVQMLAGQKPDVDVVFSNIYFGGDLSFVETIKNLIPLDAFSDPPFLNVTTSGITAGFSIGLPNIAVGMFSIQNMNISASLTIPFVSSGAGKGITFEFDFCTIDNPFVVTVSMLGGGGFFNMFMDLQGVEGIALGLQVEAQLAVDFVVASGSISIEVGIFLVYWNPTDCANCGSTTVMDPVTGQTEQPGWLIGGYLRLRGELDVAGIITISVELYLQITYSPTTGKCIASGFISVDVSLFFFSVSAKIPFSRQFSGSNGDPTFAQMMSPGGVDPMLDPTLTSGSANDVWDPFAEYCMAYAS